MTSSSVTSSSATIGWFDQDDGCGGSYRVYKDCDGVPHPDYSSIVAPDYGDQLEKVKNMDMREDDILIAGFPKSGNHWLYEIVSMIASNVAEFTPLTFGETTIEITPTHVTSARPSPRVLHTHLRPNRLPTQVIKKRAKTIIILRNPKDTCVSLYKFMSKFLYLSPFKAPFDQFFTYFLEGKAVHGKWIDFMTDYDSFRKENPSHPVHVLTYESLKENPESEIKRLADFLGKPLSGDDISAIASKTAFDNMSATLNAGKMSQYHKIMEPGAPGLFRKGIVGDWRSVLTTQQSEELDDKLKELMAQSPLAALVLPFI